MQFLQWLFKATHEKGKDDGPSSPTNQKEIANDQVVGPKHIIVFKHNGGVYGKFKNLKGSKPGAKKYLKLFFLCRKDTATACFYRTIYLKRPSDINKRQHWNINTMKMKKDEIGRGLGIGKMDQANHTGNKVLPISETTNNTSGTNDHQSDGTSKKKEKLKGDKAKTMSRMKELLRWAAAAAKSEKAGKFMGRKVLQFRNRGALITVADDDQLSNESPKISFRWDVESCSTISSAYSAISAPSSLKNGSTLITQPSLDSIANIHDSDHTPPRKGNWITTDSEFVVLEL